MTRRWIFRASGPRAAPVPTAPDILPTRIRGVTSRSRCLCRSASDAKTAILRPKVIGTAAWPWVRPSMTVRLCFAASFARAARRASRSSARIPIASRSWRAVAVSEMSLLVAPRWT